VEVAESAGDLLVVIWQTGSRLYDRWEAQIIKRGAVISEQSGPCFCFSQIFWMVTGRTGPVVMDLEGVGH
jgi:hypothetical protein